MSSEVIEVQGVVVDDGNHTTKHQQHQLMAVQIPPGVTAGMTFVVQSPEGVQFQVQVPQGVSSGSTIQVQPPAAPVAIQQQQPQLMAVRIPPGLTAGMQFVVQSPEGVQFQVQVPQGASGGSTIQVQTPGAYGATMPQHAQPIQYQPGRQQPTFQPGEQTQQESKRQQYCGPISCCIGIVLVVVFWPAALFVPCCPCDTRDVNQVHSTHTQGRQTGENYRGVG